VIPKIVAAGIDTLYVGFNITKWLVDDSAFNRLADAKGSAGDKLFGGKGVTIDWGGREFNLSPRGTKGYEFVMSNDDERLCIARVCQGGRVFPEVFAELNSSFLWGKGYDKAHKETRRFIDGFAEVKNERINRVDLCADVAMKLPRLDVKNEIVTRAQNKRDYFEVEHYTHGQRDTGYRFGSGKVMARIYDKTHEMKKSKKEWFGDIWIPGGWDGKSVVTRFEFQCRRPFLKEYQINSYDDMIQHMPDVWRYLTEKWIVLKKPNPDDSNRRRWPTSESWELVQRAGSRFGQCLGVQRWKQKEVRIEPLMAQLKGIIASEVAIDSKIRGEYFAVDRIKSEISKYLESEELHNKVFEKRGRYGNLSN